MKNKLFNMLLVSSSLLCLTSTLAVSAQDSSDPKKQSSLLGSINSTQTATTAAQTSNPKGVFSGIGRAQDAASTSDVQTSNLKGVFGGIGRAQNAASTSDVQTSNLKGVFSGIGRAQNAASTSDVQTNNSRGVFSGIGRAQNTASTSDVQTNNSKGVFSGIGRAQNAASTSDVQTNNSKGVFDGIDRAKTIASADQTASQGDMAQRTNNAATTALKTPHLTAFGFNSARHTISKNGVVVKDESAYRVKTTDTSGNSTITQEGSPSLLNGFDQKPTAVAAPVTTLTSSTKTIQSIFDNYYKPSQKPIVVTHVVPGNLLGDNLKRLNAEILEDKIKKAVRILLQKPEQEIKTLLTDNDQYRALSPIWPTLNNNQKVESTIDYLFTAPQVTNITHTTLTSTELTAVKEESVAFVQKSNVTLPNNLEDFVNNFEANVRTIFARNGESLDDIL